MKRSVLTHFTAIRTSIAIMIAVLLCAVVVLGGGLVPNLFVAPALDAIAGL